MRERARWTEPDSIAADTVARFYAAPEKSSAGPATDIAAVLTVIMRRSDANRRREQRNGWQFNFANTNLRGADLTGAHFARTNFQRAHLEKPSCRARTSSEPSWRARTSRELSCGTPVWTVQT